MPTGLRVAELLLKKCNFKKTPKIIEVGGNYSPSHAKDTLWPVVLDNCEKSAVKHSLEKPFLFNFVNLSTISFPGLFGKTHFHF